MKLNKLLLTMGLAAGLGLAAQAHAAAFYSGTLASWDAASPPGITDGDGDSIWSLISYSGAIDISTTQVLLSEIELGSTDFYTVNFDFAGGGINGGDSIFQSGHEPEQWV